MVIAAVALLGATAAVAVRQPVGAQPPTASAELKDDAGKVVGRATLTQGLSGGGVWISVEVSGISPGVHGIHVHAVGTCTAPGFLSSGGHFNPGGHKHGFVNPEGSHAGDLPNMTVPSSGSTRYETANYRLTLTPGPTTIFDADGSALVIHATADDYVTDPAGNAGARVACGVITRR